MEMFDRSKRVQAAPRLLLSLLFPWSVASAQVLLVFFSVVFGVETLEEVMVTARRRAESLQDTPVVVTALSADSLQRQQVISTTDLDKVAPNIQFHSYGTLTGNNSAAQVFIRGIGQTDATPAVDPGVGVYIDDVYMGRAVGAAMEFRDIASVQILRGFLGFLFGCFSFGGAVL